MLHLCQEKSPLVSANRVQEMGRAFPGFGSTYRSIRTSVETNIDLVDLKIFLDKRVGVVLVYPLSLEVALSRS